MRVLWISNYPLADINSAIGGKFIYNEGWKETLAKQILSDSQVEAFAVAFPGEVKEGFTFGSVGKLGYYIFPKSGKHYRISEKAQPAIEAVMSDFKPDVVHIFGSEFPHTLCAARAGEKLGIADKLVISIQGVTDVCADSIEKCLPRRVAKRLLIGDLIVGGGIPRNKAEMKRRGKYEIEALRISNNVIGRTDFDRAYALTINPKINYFFCNETLRSDFYTGETYTADKNGHNLFMSQATYPIKGLHIFLEALAILKKQYPDVMLRISGGKIISDKKSKLDFLKRFSYSEYIKYLIKKYDLYGNIQFIGPKTAAEMKEELLKCDVCITPSVIENSPNSVGEAMLLGVPTVASNVGGTNCLLEHGKEGFLYQYDLPFMAAFYISKLFEDRELAAEMGRNARAHALITHDPEKNFNKLMKIYSEIGK